MDEANWMQRLIRRWFQWWLGVDSLPGPMGPPGPPGLTGSDGSCECEDALRTLERRVKKLEIKTSFLDDPEDRA